MPQVSASTCARSGPVQVDGRQWVTEVLIVDDGTIRQSTYLAEADHLSDADLDAHLVALAEGVNAELAAG